MRTTIDAAGRVVIPKAMRDELHLTAGQDLDVSVADGRLEIEVPPTPMRLARRGDAVVAVTDRKMPPLTADLVRETLEQIRR